MIRTLPVAAEMLGLVSAGQPEPLLIWEEKDGRRQLTDKQETDPDTGELLWTVYLLPTMADRPEVLSVRTRGRQAPVLGQFGPVAVDNLMVNCRVDKSGRMAQYWEAAAVRDANQAPRKNGHQEHKPEGQAA